MGCFARPRAVLFGLARIAGPAASIVLAVAVILGGIAPASAQGFDFFGRLFGGGSRPPYQQNYPSSGYGQPPDTSYKPRRHGPSRRASEPARVPRDRDSAARDARDNKEKAVPPKNASLFVYVFGDSFGQSLAGGLDDALADRTDVAVIHKAKGSSGLVASDFYDWPKTIDQLLAESAKVPPRSPSEPAKAGANQIDPGKSELGKSELGKSEPGKSEPGKSEPGKIEPGKPEPGKVGPAKVGSEPIASPGKPEPAAASNPNKIDVAVMMIGSNDRQPLHEGGKTLAVGTPEWTAAYRTRVMAIDEAFRRRNIPLVWVGVPIARDDDFADDMAAFNDIYREAAAKTGAVYVDTWEAFSDDDGDFSAVGPDINGQIVRLRTADGVYFTSAGGRKLAHFVEAHVRRALDGKSPRLVLPETAAPGARPAPLKPDVGPIGSLTDLPSARDGRLASSAHPDIARETQGEAEKDHPPAGRADDLRWPTGSTPNP